MLFRSVIFRALSESVRSLVPWHHGRIIAFMFPIPLAATLRGCLHPGWRGRDWLIYEMPNWRVRRRAGPHPRANSSRLQYGGEETNGASFQYVSRANSIVGAGMLFRTWSHHQSSATLLRKLRINKVKILQWKYWASSLGGLEDLVVLFALCQWWW